MAQLMGKDRNGEAWAWLWRSSQGLRVIGHRGLTRHPRGRAPLSGTAVVCYWEKWVTSHSVGSLSLPAG